METRQTFFFMDKRDLLPAILDAESQIEIKYVLAGTFDEAQPVYYSSQSEVQGLGNVREGDWNSIPRYLIIPHGHEIEVRKIALYKGGHSYAIDQLINPQSVLFVPGGSYGENTLIAGKIGTITGHLFSLNCYNVFSKVIKRNTKKIGSFYVGKHAGERLNEGWRLTTSIASPPEYDLKSLKS